MWGNFKQDDSHALGAKIKFSQTLSSVFSVRHLMGVLPPISLLVFFPSLLPHSGNGSWARSPSLCFRESVPQSRSAVSWRWRWEPLLKAQGPHCPGRNSNTNIAPRGRSGRRRAGRGRGEGGRCYFYMKNHHNRVGLPRWTWMFN